MKKQHFTLILLFINFYAIDAQSNIFDIARKGTVNDIEILYNKTPDIINNKNDRGYTPFMLACYYNNEAVVRFLVDKVKNINGTSAYGSPLMAATVKGYVNIVRLLLEKKANPDITDAKNTTAIHYATLFQNIEIVKLLINAKANYNIKNNVGKTAMDFAISSQNNKLLALFKN